jgi:hypothetical protein
MPWSWKTLTLSLTLGCGTAILFAFAPYALPFVGLAAFMVGLLRGAELLELEPWPLYGLIPLAAAEGYWALTPFLATGLSFDMALASGLAASFIAACLTLAGLFVGTMTTLWFFWWTD